MRVLISIALVIFLSTGISRGQSGFVITTEDSIFHGYMRLSRDGNGKGTILITNNKKKAPRTYYAENLKYYAYKKDTFAILRDFYPFDDDTDPVQIMEARVIISKGRLKLYRGMLPTLKDDPTIVPVVTPATIGVVVVQTSYDTFIVKNRDGELRALRHDDDGFISTIMALVEDDEALAADITSRKLKFKDTREIIRRYNASR